MRCLFTSLQDKNKPGVTEEPQYLIRCTVTKHSWRGKYKRLLCISYKPPAIITLDPHTLTSTNHYDLFTDFEQAVLPSPSPTEDEHVRRLN